MITITPLKTAPLKYSHSAHFPHPCGRAGLIFFFDLQERLLEYLEKWTPGEMVLSTCDKVLMEEPGLAKVVTTIGCLSKEKQYFQY